MPCAILCAEGAGPFERSAASDPALADSVRKKQDLDGTTLGESGSNKPDDKPDGRTTTPFTKTIQSEPQ